MNLNPVDNSLARLQAGAEAAVELRGHSYGDHRQIVPTLLESMAACGCWVLEQRALSSTTTQLCFEVQLRSVYDLYGGLVCSGIELTRDSHARMTGLCTVRNHNPGRTKRRRILSVRLELIFLEQFNCELNPTVIGIA